MGFGEHRVGLGGLLGVDLWLLGFSFVFGGDPVLVWDVFDVFWGVPWVLLGFSFVVKINGSGLWVLEKIR